MGSFGSKIGSNVGSSSKNTYNSSLNKMKAGGGDLVSLPTTTGQSHTATIGGAHKKRKSGKLSECKRKKHSKK